MEPGLHSDGDAMNVKAAFDDRFILSLEEFAASHRGWLAENGVALQTWYACAYRWDKMGPRRPSAFLRRCVGSFEITGKNCFYHVRGPWGYILQYVRA